MEEAQIKEPRRRFFGEGLERINAFSDGIFAIAITLLVLEIHVPELGKGEIDQLPAKLWDLMPQILTFALSFLVIGVYWMLHHGIFSYIRRYDAGLLWLNNLFLLTIAFQPFPTAVLGQYGNTTPAVVFYSALQILSGVFKLLIWIYASYKHRLIDPDLDNRFIVYYTVVSASAIIIFAISIGLAFIDNDLAKYSWVLLALDTPIIRLFYSPDPRKKKGEAAQEPTEIQTDFGPEKVQPAPEVKKVIPVPPAPETPPSQDKDKK